LRVLSRYAALFLFVVFQEIGESIKGSIRDFIIIIGTPIRLLMRLIVQQEAHEQVQQKKEK